MRPIPRTIRATQQSRDIASQGPVPRSEGAEGHLARLICLVVLAFAVMGLTACSSTSSQKPHPYRLELVADKMLNPDAQGRPSPLQVTVYELSAPTNFESVDYFTLQGNARAALGDELVAVEQVILRPGQTHVIERPGNLQARVLGVTAAYRNLDASRWRTTIKLPNPQNTNVYKVWQFSPGEEQLRVRLGAQALEVGESKRSWW